MIELKLNKTQDKKLKVLCQSCKNKTQHKVINSVSEIGTEEMDHYNEFHWESDFEIIQCLGCETISFRSEHSNSEGYDYDEDVPYMELIYPKRTKDSWNIKNFYNVPVNLKRIYRETIDTYNADCLTLCGAGTRALVEGLCIANGITDGEVEYKNPDGIIRKKRLDNLQGKINGLAEQGKLTKDNAEILHEHRFLGNTAIHELSIPSKEELILAIEIIENVFETLYEIPQKAMQLRFKRMNKK